LALTPGTLLGPYEILALGAAGMGEVHRARDTEAGRETAILVDSLASQTDTGAQTASQIDVGLKWFEEFKAPCRQDSHA
jgi:hypothetical protein